MIIELSPVLIQAAEAPSGGGSTLIIAALGSGAIGAVIVAIVTGLFTKRKLGAEATEIITKAAAGVVESLNGEMVSLRGTLAAVRLESAEAEARHKIDDDAREARHKLEREADRATHMREMEAVRRVLQLHVAWDLIAREKLSEYGIELPDAPPLLPPLSEFPLDPGE